MKIEQIKQIWRKHIKNAIRRDIYIEKLNTSNFNDDIMKNNILN